MSEKQLNEFKTLPLITLRGLTITPHSNVQIIAARDQSIEAFKAAIESDSREIAIFCQLFDTDEAPSSDRLQKIGVLCCYSANNIYLCATEKPNFQEQI